jgi:hypothetical protein
VFDDALRPLLARRRAAPAWRSTESKVFWFFFSKKNVLPYLRRDERRRLGAREQCDGPQPDEPFR